MVQRFALPLQCWCGDDSFGVYGEISEDVCSFPCEGDADQFCGGFDALSVYYARV